jgi:hypothetical protein
LYRKGWLTREGDGRAYRYRAALTQDEYTADLMGEALAASTDHAAAFRRFAERISPAEAWPASGSPPPSPERRRSPAATWPAHEHGPAQDQVHPGRSL